MRKIRLELGSRSHDVVVGNGIVGDPVCYAELEGRQVALVVDEGIASIYGPLVKQALTAANVTTFPVPVGEKSKSWEQLIRLCNDFASAGMRRQDWVVALGGGMVCDLAGFAAASYMRGLRHVMLPTSLLAQVDASIGGKTAINIEAGKNLVGAIHQPAAVYADVGMLANLPEREFRCGLAECVKHGMLSPDILAFIEDNEAELAKGPKAEPDLLIDLVARNVEYKASVVIADQHEHSERFHLNLGHTFAHGFEAVTGFSALPHGEAVSIGLVAACRLGNCLGRTSEELTERIVTLLTKLGLPTTLPEHDRAALLKAMSHDKKVEDGKLRFVLVRTPGEIEMTREVGFDVLNEVLDSLHHGGN